MNRLSLTRIPGSGPYVPIKNHCRWSEVNVSGFIVIRQPPIWGTPSYSNKSLSRRSFSIRSKTKTKTKRRTNAGIHAELRSQKFGTVNRHRISPRGWSRTWSKSPRRDRHLRIQERRTTTRPVEWKGYVLVQRREKETSVSISATSECGVRRSYNPALRLCIQHCRNSVRCRTENDQ